MALSACLPLLATGCIGLEMALGDSSPVGLDDTSPGEADYGDLHVHPVAIDFGEVEIGDHGEASVVLSYTGEGDVIVSEASVAGGAGTVVIAGLTGLPAAVSLGQDVVVDLMFSPSAEREYTAQLAIVTDSSAAETIAVPLEGTGVRGSGSQDGADISISPSAIDFGTVDVSSINSRALTVSNIGTETFFLLDIQPQDATLDYEFEFALPTEFDPGESREVSITWRPTGIGTLSSSVTFQSDCAGEEELQVAVTGRSDDICDICAPMISVDTGGSDDHAMAFYSTTIFGPDVQNVRITNSGDETLTLQDVYVHNDLLAPNGTFSVNWGGSPVSLAPWETSQVRVTYSNTDVAFDLPYPTFDQNILHILSDAANEPDYAIELTGTGL